ncbi:apolipoprotein A-II [Pholidichthys leucotaenia]
MNAKYVFALILALQVSMGLCQLPTPSSELMQKYLDMKRTFLERLANAYRKFSLHAGDAVQQSPDENVQAAREAVQNLQARPEFQAAVKVAANAGNEITSLLEKARNAVLGLYEANLRSQIGEKLDKAIALIKVHLDEVLPVAN